MLPKEMEVFNYCDPDLLRAMNSPVKPHGGSSGHAAAATTTATARPAKCRHAAYRAPSSLTNQSSLPGAKSLVSAFAVVSVHWFSV